MDREQDDAEPEPEPDVRNCERCQRTARTELIPLMGYSEWMCQSCAATAYRSGEAV